MVYQSVPNHSGIFQQEYLHLIAKRGPPGSQLTPALGGGTYSAVSSGGGGMLNSCHVSKCRRASWKSSISLSIIIIIFSSIIHEKDNLHVFVIGGTICYPQSTFGIVKTLWKAKGPFFPKPDIITSSINSKLLGAYIGLLLSSLCLARSAWRMCFRYR